MVIKNKYKDAITPLTILTGCDDCELIKKVGKWEIELNLENKFIEESNNFDWYGYKRIDIIENKEALNSFIIMIFFPKLTILIF